MLNEITSEYIESSLGSIEITKDNFLEKFPELIQIIKNSPEFLGLSDRTQLIFDKKENREGKGAMYNRQTHTAYVTSISVELAQKSMFGLSEIDKKIVELIGLCHDLGHTSFGHTGESRVDKILRHFKISAQEFSDYYMKNGNIGASQYVEGEPSFEHHAHSTRVLTKIFERNNVSMDDDLWYKIVWGIMCHSESRVDKTQITQPLWTIARYADKFYAFTDIMDIIKSGTRIPNNILEMIKNDEFAMAKCFDKQTITQKDIDDFSTTLDYFYKEDAFMLFKQQYIEEAELDCKQVKGKTAYFIKTDESIGRMMRILQGVAKYMRKEGIIGKEEILADAMVDEIVAYIIDHPRKKDLDEKSKIIEACLYITANTDSELRRCYRSIAEDVEWCEAFDEKIASPDYKGFEKRISKKKDEKTGRYVEDKKYRVEMRQNPDIILNYNFDAEVEKVENNQIKMRLYKKIKEYRGNVFLPERRNMDSYERRDISLEERRELIKMIEIAKAGGDPFYKRNTFDGPGGEDR